LRTINFDSNELSGSLPDFSSLKSLQNLILSRNVLTGTVPDAILQLNKLGKFLLIDSLQGIFACLWSNNKVHFFCWQRWYFWVPITLVDHYLEQSSLHKPILKSYMACICQTIISLALFLNNFVALNIYKHCFWMGMIIWQEVSRLACPSL